MTRESVRVAPYGSWKSPITSDLIASETIGLGQIALDRDDVYWIESRPREGGRNVIVRRTPDGRLADVTPPPFSARTRVHEYGGGSYAVHDRVVIFSNFSDQRLYRQEPGSPPVALTPPGWFRYADGVIDRRRGSMICVREDHSAQGREAVNTLVAVDLGGDERGGRVLASGSDFTSSPRLSPDGAWLAWLNWNHPNMPWDGTELWLAELRRDGKLGPAEKIAGGVDESIFQPEWSADSVLTFVSDRSGYWNLYRYRPASRATDPLFPRAAEFGVPQWGLGMSTYGLTESGLIVAAATEGGVFALWLIDPVSRRVEPIEWPYTDVDGAMGVKVVGDRIVLGAGSPTRPRSVVEMDLATGGIRVFRRSSEVAIDPGYLSVPEAVEFPTEGDLTAHAFYYAPRNQDFAAPSGSRPPLLVMSHGGPTSATRSTLRFGIQYWTSRGIAVLDVNYGGSTGYGRDYRERLAGRWGVVDVDDCVNGARHLVAEGLVDGERLAITGGSAGGFTTLCALTFRDTFRAGASYYGVSDLEALARDTHKFESRYLDRLVGPYPAARDIYRACSPIHAVDRLSCPVIFFQGLEDRVVPPNQAEMMVEALRRKGLPVAYVAFPGEEHGFRRAENLKRAYDAELTFYSRVFGFPLADPVEPLEIANLEGGG
jgi:dipeptidyl aminopeptidase/acylaminoacyl peptidase